MFMFISFLSIVSVFSSISTGARLAQVSFTGRIQPNQCPNGPLIHIRNVLLCGCSVKEQLTSKVEGLEEICNLWKYDPLEKSCESFRKAGKIDVGSIQKHFLIVHERHFKLHDGENSEDIDLQFGLQTKLGKTSKHTMHLVSSPSPSPEPKLCPYRCQCCYVCAFPCLSEDCNCRQWICRKTCRGSVCPPIA